MNYQEYFFTQPVYFVPLGLCFSKISMNYQEYFFALPVYIVPLGLCFKILTKLKKNQGVGEWGCCVFAEKSVTLWVI